MSDTQDRRHEDKRMDKLESVVESMRSDIVEIKTKINNGFEHSIKNTENKVNYIDERNREEHKLLMGKLDKILFLWVSGSIAIILGIVGYTIKGSL